ncbi:MAG: hypothetical protein JSR46_11815 [Verrucomicrobia bacterium]|nr:hypothetical protein [Verrucomicrobiota bacterium]
MRIALLLLFVCTLSSVRSDEVITSFLQEQQILSRQFPAIEKELASLPTCLPPEQKHILFAITHFFDNKVHRHLQQEEKVAHSSDHIAYENKLLTQWIVNIQNSVNVEKMEIDSFITQSQGLLEALKRHFAAVEEATSCLKIDVTQGKS